MLLATLANTGGFVATADAASLNSASTTSDDWSTYLHDVERSGASADGTLSSSNAAQLADLWTYKTGGVIASGAAVINGTAYIGSWDGYEYALDAATGALKWKTYLGQTVPGPNCGGITQGVTSSSAVLNGVVYVGGGDAYWYALDAATGSILWNVFTGDNSATGGHYNWASPLLYNGFAYIGISSFGDCPLVQGQLWKVDLSTHQVVATASFVTDGQIGGGIWTSPSMDPATNTIFVTTGTLNDISQTMSQAIVAIDATTLAIKGHWQIPASEAVPDSDWGTTPILFDDTNGRHLVAGINKNGILYAFDRNNLAAGPVWQRQVAVGGECPQCGDGSVSSMTFANGLLYVAGGNTTINGIGFQGAVRAINPTTGVSVWEHGDANPIIPALAYDNGLVIAASGPLVEILDASTGNRLYSYRTSAGIYGPPSVAHGIIYVGSNDGNLYAFGLSRAPVPPAPDPQCPASWACQDIGTPLPTGSETVAGSNWTIGAGGAGVSGTSDGFHFIEQTASGDTQISAQITILQNTGAGAQVGLMARQANDPTAPYYAVLATPNGGLAVQYRLASGGATSVAKTVSGASLPLYLEIQRTGDIFQAATSTDGITFTLVPGSTVNVAMPTAIAEGVAASSGTSGTPGAATVANVALGSPATTPNPYPSPSPCPSNWTCADVGNPPLVGDQSLANGTWTISSAGAGAAKYSDQFHFVWQPMSGDVTLTAHIASQTSSGASAQAGLMLRQDTTASAAFYGAFVTPSKGILFEYRNTNGLYAHTSVTMQGTAPQWFRITRSSNTFSSYTSSDGVNWAYVAGTTAAFDSAATLLAGMAVSSNSPSSSASAQMDTVTLTSGAPQPPTGCPSTWNCADVGYPPKAGSESISAGVWSVVGNGDDIWGNADQMRFESQTLSGDGTISAQVASQSNTNAWAKAGVMFRASTDTGSANYAVLVTPGNGVVVQIRPAIGAYTYDVARTTTTLPVYLMAARSGTTFTAYTSADGVAWAPIPGSTVTLANLGGALLAGLAVTSHNLAALGAATFAGVTVGSAAPPPPGACPSGWTCSDVGNPALSGSQTVSGGTWTVQGAGYDIWDAADQFHYDYQSMLADGAISAHIASQTNSGPWAKAGVMVRASPDPNSAYYAVFVTPDNGIVVQYRSTAGAYATHVAATSGTTPVYLMAARSGTTFTAYTSADGVAWAPIPGSTVTLANLGGALLAGLAVTSHNTGTLGTIVFDSVGVATSAPLPPGACPSGWTCSDVGNPNVGGTQNAGSGAWAIQGAGYDIWSNYDQFHFAYQPLTTNGSVTTRVASQANTSPWAKAGVVLRQDTTAGGAYYAAFVTPGNGVVVQARTAAGGYAYQVAQISGAAPTYLRIARSGTTFTAYTSSDGQTWTPIAGSTVTLANLSSPLLAGLAVTSHNGGTLCAVTFDNVAITPA